MWAGEKRLGSRSASQRNLMAEVDGTPWADTEEVKKPWSRLLECIRDYADEHEEDGMRIFSSQLLRDLVNHKWKTNYEPM